MNRSLAVSFHAWRGIGPDVEQDLFYWRIRFGFMTLMFCRTSVLAKYREVKAEAAKLRESIVDAIRRAEGQ